MFCTWVLGLRGGETLAGELCTYAKAMRIGILAVLCWLV